MGNLKEMKINIDLKTKINKHYVNQLVWDWFNLTKYFKLQVIIIILSTSNKTVSYEIYI